MEELSLTKRILLVSSWVPPTAGGVPENVYNLFSQLSADSYCVLTSYEAIRRREATGRWLRGRYFFFDHSDPVDYSAISRGCVARERPSGRARQSLFKLERRIPQTAQAFLKTTYSALVVLLSIVKIVRAGIRIVRQARVKCVLAISDTGESLIGSYLISRLTGAPYAVYLFDIYLGNNLRPVHNALAKLFEPRIFKTASLVVVTNEGTEGFYRKRYGHPFKCATIHNSVFPKDYESKRTPYMPTEPYTILLTGHVYWAQERSVMNLIVAMDGVRDLPVRLQLYVPDPPEALRRAIGTRPNVHLAAAARSEMPPIQCNASILFLPLSWCTNSPDVIRTATPGKLAEYMASGRPILIHAPPYAYLNEYAKKHELAMVVDEENAEKLSNGIRKLLFDTDYSRQLIRNAETMLYKNHDATLNAKKFVDAMESALMTQNM